jgi:hypothetical protein
MNRDCFAARASRKFGAPQVMAYWWGPGLLTRSRALQIAAGGSKSGKPWERLIAPCALATRVIILMTDSVKCLSLRLTWGIGFPIYEDLKQRQM